MIKDAFWFPHDSNAKDDPKIVLAIEQMGLEAYGIFWMLIETLRDQAGYKYPMKNIPALARRYNTTAEKVKAVVCGYDLFQLDGDTFFYSQSLIRRMKPLEDRRIQASEAGKISAQKRKQLNGSSTTVQQTFNKRSTSIREESIGDKSIGEEKTKENITSPEEKKKSF